MTTAIASVPKETRQARERIDIRLRPDQKTCIEKAASFQGPHNHRFHHPECHRERD